MGIYTKKEKSAYRQRGYKCMHCSTQSLVYGGDQPALCGSCGAPSLELLWDHWIEQTVTVTDFKTSD